MVLPTAKQIALAMVVALIGSCSRREQPSSEEGRYPLTIGNATAWVEIADSDEKRTQGLMYRKSLPKDSGMLFVYPKSKIQTFWMKNTLVPLSIAFIRKDGTVSEIVHMTPADGRPDFLLPRYQSREKVMYGLEMPQGWFKDHGIAVGARVEMPSVVNYLLKTDDVKFSGLVHKLRDTGDPLSQYICRQLSPEICRYLENFDKDAEAQEWGQIQLLDELNFLLCREDLWRKKFAGKSAYEGGQPPHKSQLEGRLYCNRVFLRQSYGGDIAEIEGDD